MSNRVQDMPMTTPDGVQGAVFIPVYHSDFGPSPPRKRLSPIEAKFSIKNNISL